MDPITIGIALIVIAVNIVAALKYRNLFKRYKQLYEEAIKPKPVIKPHTSPKAIQAQTELQAYLEIRSKILLRDHFRCQECGFYKHLEVHHIIPRSKGGSDNPENLITLCQRCHGKKHGFANRERRRNIHTRRNRRKHFKRYLNKQLDKYPSKLRDVDFGVESLEDVHPFKEDLSPEAVARRQKLYEKWKNNELNQV